jgi:hypothetical protein
MSPSVIYFNPPSSDGGATITDYQYNVDGGSWTSSYSSSSPITIYGLSTSTHTVCIRAVNSVGAGSSACTSVTPVAPPTDGFVVVDQYGGSGFSGHGLNSWDQTQGSLYSYGTLTTLTFETVVSGVLTYYYQTYDIMNTGAVTGSMSVAGNSVGSISGTNNNSGTIAVTAGQTIIFAYTGSSMSSFQFQMYITI